MNRFIFQYTTYNGPRPGLPAKTRGPSHGPGGRRHRRSIGTPLIMGRGPGRPVKTWATSWAGQGGPNKAHTSWAAAPPGPSNFESMGRDPAATRPAP